MTRFSVRTKHAQIIFAEITPQPAGEQTYHREPHDHPHDMMLVVMKGAMHMEIGGLDYELREGSAMVIPAYVMHRGYALGDTPASLIEVFAPARADYIHLVQYQEEDFGDQGEQWIKTETDSWNPPPRPRR
jgi:mannose-6-phosphate isomerase-like protein (cupin superfamily)